jgi:hypothetical protein
MRPGSLSSVYTQWVLVLDNTLFESPSICLPRLQLSCFVSKYLSSNNSPKVKCKFFSEPTYLHIHTKNPIHFYMPFKSSTSSYFLSLLTFPTQALLIMILTWRLFLMSIESLADSELTWRIFFRTLHCLPPCVGSKPILYNVILENWLERCLWYEIDSRNVAVPTPTSNTSNLWDRLMVSLIAMRGHTCNQESRVPSAHKISHNQCSNFWWQSPSSG